MEAGTAKIQTRKQEDVKVRGRWEFDGAVDRKLSRRYAGKNVRKYLPQYSQSPTVYVRC
jgi:hypothetical protein